jgi:hypothetical protein
MKFGKSEFSLIADAVAEGAVNFTCSKYGEKIHPKKRHEFCRDLIKIITTAFHQKLRYTNDAYKPSAFEDTVKESFHALSGEISSTVKIVSHGNSFSDAGGRRIPMTSFAERILEQVERIGYAYFQIDSTEVDTIDQLLNACDNAGYVFVKEYGGNVELTKPGDFEGAYAIYNDIGEVKQHV